MRMRCVWKLTVVSAYHMRNIVKLRSSYSIRLSNVDRRLTLSCEVFGRRKGRTSNPLDDIVFLENRRIFHPRLTHGLMFSRDYIMFLVCMSEVGKLYFKIKTTDIQQKSFFFFNF